MKSVSKRASLLKLKNKGFSYIQVLMSTAMVGATLVAVMKIGEMGARSDFTRRLNFDVDQARGTLSTILADRDTCTENFQGLNLTNSANQNLNLLSVQDLTNAAGVVLFSQDSAIENDLIIESVMIPNKIRDPQNPQNLISNQTIINPSRNLVMSKMFVTLKVINTKKGFAYGGNKKVVKLNFVSRVENVNGSNFQVKWCQTSNSIGQIDEGVKYSFCKNNNNARVGDDSACSGASMNDGNGTNRYRAISCTMNTASWVNKTSSNLRYINNAWRAYKGGFEEDCDNGSVLVVDTGL